MTAPADVLAAATFRIGVVPLPWWYAVQYEDSATVWETTTGEPVVRWRTEFIVPAPGVSAVAK